MIKRNLKNTITRVIVFLVLSLSFNTVNAQWIISSSYEGDNNIDGCYGSKAWEVTAVPAIAVNNVTFDINFPPGVVFDQLTEVTANGIATTAVGGEQSIQITVPDLAANQTLTFKVFRAANCNAITDQVAGGSFFDTLDVNYNSGGTQQHLSNDAAYGEGNYEVNVPNVIVTNVTSSPSVTLINNPVTQTITIENRGLNSKIDNFYVNIDANSGFQVDASSISAGTLNATQDRIDFSSGSLAALGGDLADGVFDEGDMFMLTLSGLVVECAAGVQYNSGFSCSDNSSCNESAIYAADINVGEGFPEISIIVTPDYQASYGCSPNGSVTYTFSNTGTENTVGAGFASNFQIAVGAYWSGSGIYDNSSLLSSMGNANLIAVSANGVQIPAAYTTITGGRIAVDFTGLTQADATTLGLPLIDADGDGAFDDLPVGETITLVSEVDVACSQTPYGYNVGKVIFNNQCENNLQTTYQRSGYMLKNGLTSGKNVVSAPSDVVYGTPFQIGADFGIYLDPRAYTGCSDQYTQLQFTFSEAMDFSNLSFLGTDGRTVTPTVDATNTILTLKIEHKQSGSQNLSDFKLDNLEILCGTDGVITADYRLSYVCADCNTCEVLYKEGAINLTKHGCGNTGCDGVETTSLTAKRTSLGWASEADYKAGLPPLTDDTNLVTDLLLQDDRLNVKTLGTVQGTKTYTTIGADINYSTNHLFTFENATVTLTDASTGIVYLGTVTGTPTTSENTLRSIHISTDEITFIGLPTNFSYAVDDQLEIDANLILQSASASTVNYLGNFRVSFFGLDGTDKLNCSDYGVNLRTRSAYFNNAATPYYQTNIDGCDVLVSVGAQQTPAGIFGKYFLNEFRPINQITKMEFDIPEGFEYVENSARITYRSSGYHTYYISAGPNPTALAAGRIVLEKTNDWPIPDFDHSSSCCRGYMVVVDLIPTCGVIAGDLRIDVDFEAETRLYSTINGKQINSHSDYTNIIRTTKPVISHNTPAPITTLGEIISWNPTFTNNADYGLDYTWVKITSPSGETQLESVSLSGTNLTLISDTGTPNVWYVPLADFAATSTKSLQVNASYSSCNQDELLIDFGYSCQAQPTTFAEYEAQACDLDPLSLSYTPAPNLIQATNITPSPISISEACMNVPYTIDLKSADLAAVYDLNIHVNLPAMDAATNEYPMQYTPGTLEISNDSGTTWLPVSGDAGFSISSAANFILNVGEMSTATGGDIAINGLIGGSNIYVRFGVTPSCSHIIGTGPQVRITGNAPCGDPAEGNNTRIPVPTIKIDGVSAPFLASITTTAADTLEYCPGLTTNFCASVTITGGTTAATDILNVVIPASFSFAGDLQVDADQDCVGESSITPLSTTVNADGTTTVQWNVAAGITSGNSIGYTFKVDIANPPADIACTGTGDFEVQYLLPATLTCSGSNCSNNTYQNIGATTKTINLEKATGTLVFTSISNSYNTTTQKEDLELSFALENTSNYIIPAGTQIQIFKDLNKNGVFDTSDLVINTTSTSANAAALQTINQNVSISLSPNETCDLYAIISNDLNCMCSTVPAKIDLPSTLTGVAGSAATICELNESTILGVTTNSEYTYQWTGPTPTATTFLNDAAIAQPVFVYAGPKLTTNTVITYTLTVTKGGTCVATDTVEVTVTPAPETPIPSDTSGMAEVCDTDYINIQFTTVPNTVIKLYKDAALSIPASPATTTGNWSSTELFTTNGSIWAQTESSTTSCTSTAYEIPYTIRACADIVTIKTVDNATPREDENVVFTISIQNNGPSNATALELTDVLPTGLQFVSSNQVAYNDTTGIWLIGDLANGASTAITITASINPIDANVSITNTTTAAIGNEKDTDTTTDILSATITVTAIDECDPADSGLPDTDGDGITDICDLDDDNDGIPDDLECNSVWANWDEATNETSLVTGVLDGVGINVTSSNVIRYARIDDNLAAIDTYAGTNGLHSTGNNMSKNEILNMADDAFIYSISFDAATTKPFYIHFTALDKSWVKFSGEISIISITAGVGLRTNTFTKIENPSITDEGGFTALIPIGTNSFTYEVPNSGDNYMLGITSACSDYDDDGTPNYLDLDSDNDGCPDALEGDSSFDTDDLETDTSLGDTVETDATSTFYGVPVSATASIVGSSQDATALADVCNTCLIGNINYIDTDGDGIGNDCDLDDDNDGILDSLECSAFANLVISFNPIAPVSSNASLLIPENALGNPALVNNSFVSIGSRDSELILGFSSVLITNSGNSEGDLLVYELGSPETAEIRLLPNAATKLLLDAQAVLTADSDGFYSFGTIHGTTPFDIDAAVLNAFLSAKLVFTQIKIISLSDSAGSNPGPDIDGVEVLYPECIGDYDNDGILNYLDLDSDNDGCPDALEGDTTKRYADLDADTSLGNTVNTDGVPTNATGIVGSSQDENLRSPECDSCNSTSSLFVDTDGDGIGNDCDLDDDNDGILDADECAPVVGSITNGDGSNLIEGEYVNNNAVVMGFRANSSPWVLTNNTNVTQGLQLIFDQDQNLGFDRTVQDIDFELNSVTGGTVKSFRFGSSVPSSNSGANNAEKDITLTWNSSASGVLIDPLGEITNYNNGDIIPSGSTIHVHGSSVGITLLKDSRWYIEIDMATVTFPWTLNYNSFNAQGGVRLEGLGFWPVIACDLDDDGIPNTLDLDSDGDGCPDALEATINVSRADLNTNTSLIGEVDLVASSASYGVPLVAGTGHPIGDSQDATIKIACDVITESISLEKTGSYTDSDGEDGFTVGDTITYAFTVINTGTTTLTNITVTDPLITVNGGPITNLAAGTSDTITFSGSYVLTQADLDAGEVINTAIVTATSTNQYGEKTIITDTSDDPTDPTNTDDNADGEPDDPTVTELDADSDKDGIPNKKEKEDGTDPNDPCSSIGGTPPDGIVCGIEVRNQLVNPRYNNGKFIIFNIERYPNNTVRIYNRWGVMVYEAEGYNNENIAFKGESEGRVTVNKLERLPTGTYFYLIDYELSGEMEKMSGYIYHIR